MEWIELGEVFPIIRNGKSIKQDGYEGYPITRIETIADRYINENRVGYANIYKLDDYEDYVLQKGDILMSHINSIKHLGKTAIFDSDTIMIDGMNLLCLRGDKDKIDNYYGYYCLNSDVFLNQISHITKKSVNQASFNITNLKKIKIPVPPVETQQKIVKVLDQAQALIDKRKEQIEALDQLIESIFYTMFGDPVRNEKGWELKSWDKIFNTTTGKLNSNAMDANGKYPFFTCAKEVFRIDNYSYDCEALLLAGNNASANYDVKYYKGKFDAYQRTYILTLKEYNNYLYFKEVLENYLLEMKQISKGTNTRYLTLKLLNTFNLPVPPISLQNEFEHKVETIEKQKELLNQSLELLEENYKSIMDKAFKGQLFN